MLQCVGNALSSFKVKSSDRGSFIGRLECPFWSKSDQILRRSGMTQCATSRHCACCSNRRKRPPTEAVYFSLGGRWSLTSSSVSSVEVCRRFASSAVPANCFRRWIKYSLWTKRSIGASRRAHSARVGSLRLLYGAVQLNCDDLVRTASKTRSRHFARLCRGKGAA